MSTPYRHHFICTILATNLTNSPLIKIAWFNRSSIPDKYLLATFDELGEQLQNHYPRLPRPEFSPLPIELADHLPDYLVSMLPGQAENEQLASKFSSHSIFVFCDQRDCLVRTFQEENELAHWGVALPCTFAVAWIANKFLVWHEVLHLLNAKDCYNKFGINKCPNLRCIMRRAPSLKTCGDRLTLCTKNVKRIQRFAADRLAREGVVESN